MTRPPSSRTRGTLIAALACLAFAAGLLVLAHRAAASPLDQHDPIGRVDHVTVPRVGFVRMRGWAADPDALATPLTVMGLVNGSPVISSVTNVARPDVVAARQTGPNPGFDVWIPVPAGAPHTVCLAAHNVASGVDTVLRCVTSPIATNLTTAQLALRDPAGRLESFSAGSASVRVVGWASEPDDRSRPVTVVVYVDGQSEATVVAARSRPKLALKLGTSVSAGFDITVPVGAGAHLACVSAVNVGLGHDTSFGCGGLDTRGPAGTAALKTPALNTRVVAEANRHLGQAYVWGAAGPTTFDCSGLVVYSYHRAGFTTTHSSAAQFRAARLIPLARALAGDLVFYHDSTGLVFHVGIYIGNGMSDAAVDTAEGVRHQAIWDTTATYGSFSHT